MNANDYTHIFATFLPPSVDDTPICGATLARDWVGRGKPECPDCNAERARILAARKAAPPPRAATDVINASAHLIPWFRKDSDWLRGYEGKNVEDPGVLAAVATLPSFPAERSPMDRFQGPRPQFFVAALPDGSRYLVDHQGYDYARYIARLP